MFRRIAAFLCLFVVVSATVSAGRLIVGDVVYECGEHGRLEEGQCVCDEGWYGEICQIYVSELMFGKPQTASSPAFAWDYWVYDADKDPIDEITIEVAQQPVDNGVNDCDTYIKKGALPNFRSHDYHDTSLRPVTTYTVNNPSGKYFVGVTGFLKCQYSIVVSSSVACAGNCSGHGVCNEGVCECDQDWYGDSCEVKAISIPLGKSIRSVTTDYCVYFQTALSGKMTSLVARASVDPSSSGTFAIYARFDQLPSPSSFDHYNASDGNSAASLSLDVDCKRIFFVVCVDQNLNKSHAVTLQVSEVSSCQNNCSNRGVCIAGKCICSGEYGGEYCQTLDYPITPDNAYHGHVSPDSWNFYFFKSFIPYPLQVYVMPDKKQQHYSIFVARARYPNYTDYDYLYTSTGDDLTTSLIISKPQDASWWIGVVSNETVNYTLQLSYQQPECHNGGTWRPHLNACDCPTGWADPVCTTKVTPIFSGQLISGDFLHSSMQIYQFSLSFSPSVILIHYRLPYCIFFCSATVLIAVDRIPTFKDYDYHLSDVSLSPDYVFAIHDHSDQSARQFESTNVFISTISSSYSYTTSEYTLSVWHTDF